MRSLLLVHGAGSGPWIWDGWTDAFPGVDVDAVDLHAGLDVARASMSNYEAAVVCAAGLLPRPLALCGWSMGGLATMMAARRVEPEALVLLEPSPPAEVQGVDESVSLDEGTFGPEQAYGSFPPGVAARAESALARAERKRGVSVPSLPSPTLVVHGDEFPDDRGRSVAAVYGATCIRLDGLDHWGLVRADAARRAVAAWLDQVTRSGR